MTGMQLPPRVAPAALEFQGDLDRLVLRPLPLGLRAWPLLGAGLLAGLVGLAALLPVDVVVVAQGVLAADAPVVILKPMARAVLRDLLVRPGDLVQAGQVLARLDPTLPEADLAALGAERRSLAAEIARREAELQGTSLPADTAEGALQGAVLASRIALAGAERARMQAAIAALQDEIAALAAATPALEDRVALAARLEATRADLAARRLATESEALAARAARLEAETDLADQRARLAERQRQLQAAQDERAVFELALHREAVEALPALRLRLAQIDDALDKAARLAELTTLVAPRDAVVISVAPGGIGAVMAEGEPIVALVPRDAPLIAEIGIPSDEAGQVAPGAEVVLKIDAFPWRRMGAASGILQAVSPASVAPESGGAARHPARVSLTAPPADLAETALIPGMTLSAEIRTGRRSVLSFFLDPLLRGLGESLREP